jgi:RimJ/RimL family protein N-acetyltransferase
MNDTLILNSGRLTLRPITLSDSRDIFHYRSDSKTNKYQGWIPKSIDDVNDFIKNRVSPIIDIHGTWFQLVITLKPGGKIIGDIGLHFIDKENKQVEIGCTLNKDYHGKGYATEAISKVLDYLFNTLHKHRIIASIDPQNKDSIRLFKRLNFHLVNKRPDDVIYEILEIKIEKIIENKKRFLDLLLLADEQENMIDKYLPDGDLFALYDGDLKSVCVVLPIDSNTCELKNIATREKYQGKGYGRTLIKFIADYYKNNYKKMLVGTGETPAILSFYESCGFVKSHRIKNFFTDHYDHSMFDGDIQLVDMIYLKKDL